MSNYSSDNSGRPGREGGPERRDEFSRPAFNEYRGYTPSLGIDLREAANISVVFIVFAWIIFPPLGIFLTVLKVLGSKQKEEAVRWMHQYGANGDPAPPRPLSARQAKKAAKAEKGRNSWPNMLFWFGLCALFVGAVSIFDPLQFLFLYGFNRYDLWDVFSNLGWLASGAAMLFASRTFKKRNRLWKKMKAIVGRRDNILIGDIAAALPASYKDTSRALESAIDHGEFGPSAYLDMRSKSLVVRGPAPEPPQEARATPKPQKEPPKKAQPGNQYDAVLLQLREINQAIPGEEMSAKIDRLETVTAKIFELAEKDPEKLPQLRRFMDYYLPTALKLLKSYAQFDSQGVDGAIISDSKKKIEETMDTLVVGFEQQLDKLFQNDALDVSADISVLKNMMAQDGLNGSASPFSQNGSL